MKWLLTYCCLAAGLLFSACAVAQQISLAIDGIDGPSLSLRKLMGVLSVGRVTTLDLQIAEVVMAGNRWNNVRLHCPELKQERDVLICAQGALEAPVKTPLNFRYSVVTGELELTLQPAAGEEWRLTLGPRGAVRTFALTVSNGQVTRLNAWWPAGWPKPNAGSVSGRLAITDESNAQASVELALTEFGFGDDSGLHAGEKIGAAISLQAQLRGESWQWHSRLEWKNGEVFWQPLFARGLGQMLNAAGVLEAGRIRIERGRFGVAGVGDVDFSLTYDRKSQRISATSLEAANIEVAALYEKLLKPALQGTALGDLRADGRVDIALELREDVVAAIDLTLKRVSVEDKERRFGLFGVNGSLPWRRNDWTNAQLHIDGGEILRVPFGAFELPLEMRGIRARMRTIQIPVLDGSLTVDAFAANGEKEGWRWRFTGGIAPISMEQFTAALGLPPMHGTLSATIPDVSYRESTLKVAGALVFKVFDGTIQAQKLMLENPLGQVPRFTADVDMRSLDLELLTRTFSFGNITGRVDAQVNALELVNWEPVHFDARIASSAGEYPRRISQAAVQNISSLGGAGAGAAIQRSFLRFFEHFGYSALGLSCRLEHGVCQMGGVENVPQGYVIVKGGGIPAISVLGYNRSVGWHELISRLKHVIQDNVRPVVR